VLVLRKESQEWGLELSNNKPDKGLTSKLKVDTDQTLTMKEVYEARGWTYKKKGK
jgi:hypothetical protein